MKLDKGLLIKSKTFRYDETIEFDKKIIENTSLVKAVAPTKIKGEVRYNLEGDFIDVYVEIQTELTLISRFTLKEFKQPMDIVLERTYTFDKQNKQYDILADGFLNLSAEIYNEIMYKIPIERNENSGKICKQGDKWTLTTEDDLKKKKASEDQFDPRFIALRKYIKK